MSVITVTAKAGRIVYSKPVGGKLINHGEELAVRRDSWISSRIDAGDLIEVSAKSQSSAPKKTPASTESEGKK